jgi:hypothetical protein
VVKKTRRHGEGTNGKPSKRDATTTISAELRATKDRENARIQRRSKEAGPNVVEFVAKSERGGGNDDRRGIRPLADARIQISAFFLNFAFYLNLKF